MIRYSCDRCHKCIQIDEELRYTVTIEVQVAMDSSDDCEDTDEYEQLYELNEILERMSDEETIEITQSAYLKQTYDLCADCHREFMENPLGASEQPAKLGFSDN